MGLLLKLRVQDYDSHGYGGYVDSPHLWSIETVNIDHVVTYMRIGIQMDNEEHKYTVLELSNGRKLLAAIAEEMLNQFCCRSYPMLDWVGCHD